MDDGQHNCIGLGPCWRTAQHSVDWSQSKRLLSVFSRTTARDLLPRCMIKWVLDSSGLHCGRSFPPDMLLVDVEDRLRKFASCVFEQLLPGSEFDQLISKICFNVGFNLSGFFKRDQSVSRCRG